MLPVVCLPGLLSTAAVYGRVMAGVPAPGASQVVRLPALGDFGAISAAIASQLPSRCLLVGHSMGAYLCLDLWRRVPERIAGMALLSCTAAADSPATAEGRQKAVRYARNAGIAALAEAVAKQTMSPAAYQDEGLRAQVLAMAEAIGVETFAAHQTALAGRPDSIATLPDITCPVLAVTGSLDAVTPPQAGWALAASIPRGVFHEIEGAGHMLPLEAPDMLAVLLRPFLSACSNEVLT